MKEVCSLFAHFLYAGYNFKVDLMLAVLGARVDFPECLKPAEASHYPMLQQGVIINNADQVQ